MDSMFLLPAAVKHDPAIDVWLNERTPALGTIARKWFARMRDRGADVRELIHDGCPVACVGDAPPARKPAMTMATELAYPTSEAVRPVETACPDHPLVPTWPPYA